MRRIVIPAFLLLLLAFAAGEQGLAHFDGQSWTFLQTPADLDSVRALAVGALAIGSLFDNLKLKDDLLAYHYGVDTLLPKLP